MNQTTAQSSRRRPELLAPAGSPAALIAAVNNGADAVYLGMGELNARRGAENFDLETLAEGARFAHLRGARIYLTANIVVLPEEMRRAVDLVDSVWAAGVDAVIVQDLGLLRVLRRALPDVRVHASTQIDAHNVSSVRALAELGCSRVTLARELSVPQIAHIARSVDVEVESFVHGSLCYSYSGQCLMSSMIGGRSANRGLCAQPCRMPYTLLRDGADEVVTQGRYLLSPRDLAGIGQLPHLVGSGVSALKIEGRMKAPEYVAVVVGVYRAALDRALADPDGFAVTDAEWELLEEAFNRGFSEAYLAGIKDSRMMNTVRPNNRGVPVGRVGKVSGDIAEVALDRAIDAADTIEFWTGRGRFAQRAGELTVRGQRRAGAPAGAVVSMTVEGGVAPGDRVFRVANAAMLDAARRTFEGREALEHRAVPVSLSVRLRIGEPLRVRAEADGAAVVVEGSPVEAALTKAVTADQVIEHVGRLGGSGYVSGSFEVDLDASAGIGFSALHHARREALEALDAERLRPWTKRQHHRPVVVPAVGPKPGTPHGVELVVCVPEPSWTEACVEAGADRVLWRVTAADDPSRADERTVPLLPRVAYDREVESLMRFVAPDHEVASGNLGVLVDAVASDARVTADWPLNVVNPWAAETLDALKATMTWASHELTAGQLSDLVTGSPVPVGVVVYGRVELMIAERCVLQNAGPCDRACRSCERRTHAWALRDQKGYDFPVVTDATGRSHIYNSVTLDLARSLDEVLDTGVSALRVDVTIEDLAETIRVIGAYRSTLDAVLERKGVAPQSVTTPSTSGHFYRGVR